MDADPPLTRGRPCGRGGIDDGTRPALREARTERFDFLGYSFGPHWSRKQRRMYIGASPSAKSRRRLRAKVHALLTPTEQVHGDLEVAKLYAKVQRAAAPHAVA